MNPILSKRDLIDFTIDDKIVDKFEKILRVHNISDRENAFNRLIALLVCKLADEIQNNNILDFQYMDNIDTYESLYERLNKLYKFGMKNILNQEIQDLDSFKYYSNNHFAFLEIYDIQSFNKNGKILVDVVRLFQNYRFICQSNQQFLGDLFEKILNKGFKQDEGQFFTPIPIVKFILYSLPLEKFKNPKIIDYACGSGHFLTEASKILSDSNNIYGIEKDYRLARVSKIALFMQSAVNSNIILGDGLENHAEIKNNSFDILVSNPPYSISGFKSYLNLENIDLKLTNKIGDNSGEIEVLFVERMVSLLKENGIAAIILPLSLLDKDLNSYICAREQILKNFYIRAIVKLTSKTFSDTSNNTVILFLEKKSKIHDNQYYSEYLEKIGVSDSEYQTFLAGISDIETYCDYFKMYYDELMQSTEIKNLIKSKKYKLLSKKEQKNEIKARFYSFAKAIEDEKLFYFNLTNNDQTIIINIPDDKQKEILGYDWSNRKGSQGIKILSLGGKMYCDNDRNAQNTLAYIIKQAFYNENPQINNDLKPYVNIVNTSSLLDFTKPSINKAIKINDFSIKSKYKLVSLNDKRYFSLFIGKRIKISQTKKNGNIPVYSANVIEPLGFIDELLIKDFQKNSVLWGIDGDWIVKYIPANIKFYPTDHCGVLRVNTNEINTYYLALVLFVIGYEYKFSRNNRASIDKIKDIKIPIPPLYIQEQIANIKGLDNLNNKVMFKKIKDILKTYGVIL